MLTTNFPKPERSVARAVSHGVRPAHRRALAIPPRRVAPADAGQPLRERVADAFRAMAHGAGASDAHESTLGFYRAGGQAWARGLEARHDLRAQVAEAFRATARGARPAAAQARALGFYRAGGHAWASRLG